MISPLITETDTTVFQNKALQSPIYQHLDLFRFVCYKEGK